LFVRLDLPQANRTIPFWWAETTIAALYEMLGSATLTAADPNYSQLW